MKNKQIFLNKWMNKQDQKKKSYLWMAFIQKLINQKKNLKNINNAIKVNTRL